MISDLDFIAFINRYTYAFIVVDYVSKEVHMANTAATKLYQITTETVGFEDIFSNFTPVGDETFKTQAKKEGNLDLWYPDVVTTHADGSKQLVKLHIGTFDYEKNLVFVEIIPSEDTRLEKMIEQIDKSNRAEGLLNWNSTLSIIHCNDLFHKVFESNEELIHSHFKNELINGFQPKVRYKLMSEIQSSLKTSQTFSTKIQVFTSTGEEKWYSLDLQKRTLDQSGTDKLVVCLVNIDKEVETEQQLDEMTQFFNIMQTLSGELLYRFNPYTRTLQWNKSIVEKYHFPIISENFPDQTWLERVIHPEDREEFVLYVDRVSAGETLAHEARMRGESEEYQYHRFMFLPIFNPDHSIKELLGSAVNIHKQKETENQLDLVNQYLSIMQESTNDILYRHDLTKDTLVLFRDFSGTGKEFLIEKASENIIDQNIVHPEDRMLYFQAQVDAIKKEDVVSIGLETPIRLNLYGESYQWYKVRGKKISDKSGSTKEVFGAFINVSHEQELENKFKEVNQYFHVMQELTDDILYRVDIQTKTMYHVVNFDILGISGSIIPNFLETFIEKQLVHPADVDIYRKFDQDWEQGGRDFCKVRLAIHNGVYEWYKIERKKIYNEQRKLVEIMGKMSNIQNEQNKVEELNALNQFFTAMQEMDRDVVYRVDVPTMTLKYNEKMKNGNWQEKVIPDYFSTFQKDGTVHPDDKERYVSMIKDWFDGKIKEEDFECHARFKLVSDHYIWYDIKGKKIYDSKGNFVEVYGKLVNIDKTQALKSEHTLLNQYFEAIQDLIPDKLFHVNIATKAFYHTDTTASKLGIPLEIPDFIETMVRDKIIHPETEAEFRHGAEKLLAGEQCSYKTLALVDQDTYNWFEISGRYIYDENGVPFEIFGKMENLQAMMELENKANYDQLTLVLRKIVFEEEVNKILKYDSKGSHHALVIIDMDDFKTVNDTYGHKFGDFVLKMFAERINNCIRGTDLIGRLGGDEFVVFLKGVFDSEMALNRVYTMLERLKPPFADGTHSHYLGASIGVAIIPEDGITYGDLYLHADKAVYAAKRKGKNRAMLYTSDLD